MAVRAPHPAVTTYHLQLGCASRLDAPATISASATLFFSRDVSRVERMRSLARPRSEGLVTGKLWLDEPQRQKIKKGGSPVTTKMRFKSPKPASFLRVAYSAPAPDESILAEIRRFT